jgi:eukaryotic-like serine/threonine-protein kinase
MPDTHSHRSLVEQLAEEFARRHRRGERPSVTEYTERYPQYAEQIRDLFPVLLLLEQAGPPPEDAAAVHTPPEDTPRLERLGDYRILREVGRGGMGIVYEAEQESLGRRVALKVLPPRLLLEPHHLARFQREAKAAARLHHTNIVPVYGVGEHGGLHYYVMQFIPGQGLNTLLAELARQRAAGSTAAESRTEPAGPAGPLSSGPGRSYWQSVARIGLQVAEALAYAHGQGVLHRDIKPSNLLLDAQGTAWVTDFGLAKAVGDEDSLTQTGDLVGTLRYLAPERVGGQGDARSDVYSLGLTLYEMLTLRPAFTAADRNHLLRQVTYEEPLPPRKLEPAVPRDLETVVLKAIAREPGRRYASAAELADDLRRFAEDKPIRARRLGTAERLGLWARRNPRLAGVTAALLATLALGVPTVLWKWREAARERDAARRAQAQADLHFAQARAAVDTYWDSLQNESRLREVDLNPLQLKLMAAAVPYYEAFVQQRQDDPELEAARGTAYLRLGWLRMHTGQAAAACADAEKGVEIFTDLARSHPDGKSHRASLAAAHLGVGSARKQLGHWPEAEAAFRRAVEVLRGLVDEAPADALVRKDLASAQESLASLLAELGNRAEAEALHREALAGRRRLVADFPDRAIHRGELAQSLGNLGNLFREFGRLADAEAHHREALGLLDGLVAAFPAMPDYQQERGAILDLLGVVLSAQGRGEEAEAAHRQALDAEQRLADAFPSLPRYRAALAHTHSDLARLLRERHRHAEAEAALDRAQALRRKLTDDFPDVPAYCRDLAVSYKDRASLLEERGRPAEAEAEHRRALDLLEKLVADQPAAPGYRHELAQGYTNLGVVLCKQGKLAAAEPVWQRALALHRRLAEEFPRVPAYRQDLVITESNLSQLLSDTGRPAEGEAALRRVLALREALAAEFPDAPHYRQDLARTYSILGTRLHDAGRQAEAEPVHRRCLALRQQLAAEFPNAPRYPQEVARVYNSLGLTLLDLGRSAEAEAAHRLALPIRESLAARFPGVPGVRYELAASHGNLGLVLDRRGCPLAAEAELRQALLLHEQLAAEFPAERDHQLQLGGDLCNFGNRLADGRESDAALPYYDRAVSVLERLLAREPRFPRCRLFLRNACWGRARVLDRLARPGDAARDWARAAELDAGPERPRLRANQALALARAADHAAAVALALELVRAPDAPGDRLYDAACVCALAAAAVADGDDLRGRYAAQAVELLRRSRANSRSAETLGRDEALAALRGRPEFQQFLRELAKP